MRDIRYVFLGHFLADVLDAPRIFNKAHQGDDVLVCELRSARMNLLAILEVAKGRPGPNERRFIENWVKPAGKFNPGKGVAFDVFCPGGVDAAQRSIDKVRAQILDKLVSEISAFLPPGSVLHAFGVFDILAMPSLDDWNYGLKDIEILATFAQDPKVMDINQVEGVWQVVHTTTQLGVDVEKAQNEWEKVWPFIGNEYRQVIAHCNGLQQRADDVDGDADLVQRPKKKMRGMTMTDAWADWLLKHSGD